MNPGSKATKANAGQLLTEQLPKVVLDAITVTRGLGMRFLWIDKYCINQDDPSEKHHQVGQMDAIYRRAEITIIAAAGEDENFGLPGVGSTIRNPQPVAMLDDITIISTMAQPKISIKYSKWWTRGWTYQEAVLSRRRLVFTRDQVYFECNSSHCYESLRLNSDLLQSLSKDESLDVLHRGILSGREGRTQGIEESSYDESLKRYFQLAETYTSKNLSFEEDSLRAFLGIAKDAGESKFPIRHLWGVPVIITGAQLQVEDLTIGLLWQHIKVQESHRRQQFPSWSWAGWAGAITFFFSSYHSLKSGLQAVQLEYETGAMVDYLQLTDHSMKRDLSLSYPVALHFDAWFFPPERLNLTIGGKRKYTIDGFRAIMSLSEPPENEGTLEELFSTREWEMILLGTDFMQSPYLMVVKHGSKSTSRVGIIYLDHPTYPGLNTSLGTEGMTRRRIRLV